MAKIEYIKFHPMNAEQALWSPKQVANYMKNNIPNNCYECQYCVIAKAHNRKYNFAMCNLLEKCVGYRRYDGSYSCDHYKYQDCPLEKENKDGNQN
jgi:hypothetical protein